MANGTNASLDSIVHGCRVLMNRYSKREDYICISVDAANAFNACSRQRMLDLLTTRAPILARFINMTYGGSPPSLIIQLHPPKRLQGQEDTKQGAPASMLLFSVTIHSLVQKNFRESILSLNRWYADDGTMIGPVDSVCRALDILITEGPVYNFHLNAAKMKAFWHRSHSSHLARLQALLPLHDVKKEGLALLGAPIGSDQFV